MQGGPDKRNEYWVVTRQQVQNPGPSYPQVEVFKNFIAQSSFIEGTRNGISGTSDSVIRVLRNEFLIWSWSNATPGTVCSVTIYGNRMVTLAF